MGARPAVCNDVARREEFLGCLRAKPRSTVTDIAAAMGVSVSAVRNLIIIFERAGQVASAIDPTARQKPHSTAPRVAWLVARRPARIGKPKIPRPAGFVKPRPALQDWPYVHTGTPADCAGGIQVLRSRGPVIPADGRRA